MGLFHAISNTLSLYFCFSLSLRVSALYSVLRTSTSYMRVFVALLSSLEFHTFPSACQVPLASPILLSTSLSVPSCIFNINFQMRLYHSKKDSVGLTGS